MLGDQRHHHHRHGTGRAGNHARATAKNSGQQAHHECSIKSDQGINPGHKGEGDCLWHQGQCHCQTGQYLVFKARTAGATKLEHV